MEDVKKRALRSPYAEIIILVSVAVVSFLALYAISFYGSGAAEDGLTVSSVALIMLALFLLSVAITIISVMAGIGGGVIFTPMLLAFTSINSVIVRAAGLIVAMFSGLVSTGVFLKKGMANFRLCLILSLSQGVGALLGATLAVRAAETTGESGEGIMRMSLGVLLLLMSVYFFLGGKKLEWPVVNRVDRFTAALRLDGAYYEPSDGTTRSYRVTRAWLGIILIFAVGVIGGFFGLGGGWAIAPVMNLGMGAPLKLAAASSSVILGFGSGISVWPYIFAGAAIPLFLLPRIAGQVLGGVIGSHLLSRVRVKIVRLMLIGIMLFTGFGLVTKGLEIVGVVGKLPPIVSVVVFGAILAGVVVAAIASSREKGSANEQK